MEGFVENLLTASFHGSVLILAVLVIRLVLWKTPKKYICLLWLLAGIRLLLPIEIRSDLSLQPRFALPALPEGSWKIWLICLWAVIAAGFGVYSLVSYRKLKQRVRGAVPIRGGWESDHIDTAFILGFVKPKILIPTGMSSQSRQYILAHERTHLDKGDHWIKMIGFLALALHWFNPLVWVAYICLCKDIEMACDQRVVQFMEVAERKSYSAALLSCSSRRFHLAASPVAFGEVNVKKRIISVLNYKKPSFWISLLGVLAFFFVAICFLTSPAGDAAKLTPEQQAQMAQVAQCREELEAKFNQSQFHYDVSGTDARGSLLFQTKLVKLGDDRMWNYLASLGPETADGRMEYGGKHYAWSNDSWVETDAEDRQFTAWQELFLWDMDTVSSVSDTVTDQVRNVSFHACWQDENQTVYTETVTLVYDLEGTLLEVIIDQPNYPNTQRVYLKLGLLEIIHEGREEETPESLFAQAGKSIQAGFLSSQELDTQAEYDSWGFFFRVDDDRLSGNGADVGYSQSALGQGVLSTTDEYWLEKNVDGQWQPLPTIANPNWNLQRIGITKDYGPYGYLDWTPIYGQLQPGRYRLGKNVTCQDGQGSGSKTAAFYAEFELCESVDLNSPEAKAAVERCYEKLEELKARKVLHWYTYANGDSTETWTDGKNFMRINKYNGLRMPQDQWSEHDKELFPRTDITIRYDGVGYHAIREDPENLTSNVLGVGIGTLSPNRGGYTWAGFGDELFLTFFERNNHTISFPEGTGVVSPELVRFTNSSALLTYRFDSSGNLIAMEYKTWHSDGTEFVTTIEIREDSPEEIQEKIASSVQTITWESFSWEEAEKKYTSGGFDTRQQGFVNTTVQAAADPLTAAKLARKEYPNLSQEVSTCVFRDEAAGMWKVTFQCEVSRQAQYDFRDVYLTDDGITRLLVYEGPLKFDESRK